MALTGSEEASRLRARSSLLGSWARLRARLLDAEHMLVQRLAGTVFLIRVFSAVLAFGSQILFARWMGTFEFGIYVYVWTWVLLLGQAIDLGLGTAAQRFIPQYRDRGMVALLRGFVAGSRWLAVGIAIAIAAVERGLRAPARAVARQLPDHPALSRLPDHAGLCARQRAGRHLAQLRLGRPRHDAGLYRAPAAAHGPDGGGLSRRPADGCGDRDDRRGGVDLAADAGSAAAGEPRACQARRARPQGLRVQDLDHDRAADPDGRRLLFAAGLHRRARAAVLPAAGRGRGLLRRRQDAGAGLVHLLFGVGNHRAPFQQLSRRRRPRGTVRLHRPIHQMDVLAVAGGDRAPAPVRAADAGPVRRRVHRRLSPDVHPGRGSAGARRHRPDRAAAQHAGRAAHLRAGLCRGLRYQSWPVLCAHPAVRHGRRRHRHRERADHRIHHAVRRDQEPAWLPRFRLGPRGAF